MKTRHLTHAQLTDALHYDPSSGAFTWIRPAAMNVKPGSVAGCLNCYGYVSLRIGGVIHKAHRLAWFYVTGSMPPCQIDHINGKKSDNRFANLRLATEKQNAENRPPDSRNKSGVRGVHFNSERECWTASIGHHRARKFLGNFDTLHEATMARLKAERELYTHHRAAS